MPRRSPTDYRGPQRNSAASVPARPLAPRVTNGLSGDPEGGLSRLVREFDREPDKEVQSDAKPAGEYRVIHGRIALPLPTDTFTDSTGKRDYDKPTQKYAREGDVVWLSSGDATRMVRDSVVEPMNASPSKVGQVWKHREIDRQPVMSYGG